MKCLGLTLINHFELQTDIFCSRDIFNTLCTSFREYSQQNHIVGYQRYKIDQSEAICL